MAIHNSIIRKHSDGQEATVRDRLGEPTVWKIVSWTARQVELERHMWGNGNRFTARRLYRLGTRRANGSYHATLIN